MKKLFSAILVLAMTIALSIQSSAIEYLVPISVKGASGAITMTIESQKDGHKESYPLELDETNNYELLRKLEPNTYRIVSVVDEEGNSVVLDKYEFTIEDTSNAQSIVLNASMEASEQAEKYSGSLIKMLGIGNSDIAVFVVLIVLIIIYVFIKKKKEKELETAIEENAASVQERIEPNPSMKVTEYNPDDEKGENE